MRRAANRVPNPYDPFEDHQGKRGLSFFAWLAFASINVKVCALLAFFLPQSGMLCMVSFLAYSLILANVVGGDALAPLSAIPMKLIERLVIIIIASALFLMFATDLMNASSDPRRRSPPAPAASSQEATPEHANPIENQTAPAEDKQ